LSSTLSGQPNVHIICLNLSKYISIVASFFIKINMFG